MLQEKKRQPARVWRVVVPILTVLGSSSSSTAVSSDVLAVTDEAKLVTGESGLYSVGEAVDIDGDTIAIGIPGDSQTHDLGGSTFVFRRLGQTWSQETRLTSADNSEQDFFGASVGIEGDWLVVGAPHDDGSSGSAYVFQRVGETWTQQSKLTASDRAQGDSFGWSVAISGDRVVIGARMDNQSSGSAYVFHRDGAAWSQETRLVASDAAQGDHFGSSVAISGDVAVAGAPRDDGAMGSAYVFRRHGASWSQEAKLTSTDRAQHDRFGHSVASQNDTAVVGCEGCDKAYVFQRHMSTWRQQARLRPSGSAREENFGVAVSIAGDRLVVTAPVWFDAGNLPGGAYVFHREVDEWRQVARIGASDGGAGDEFGVSVALGKDTVVAGNGKDAAYAFATRSVVPASWLYSSLSGVALVGDAEEQSAVAYRPDGAALPLQSGQRYAYAPIQLPHGALIRRLRCVALDSNHPAQITATLLRGPINTSDPSYPRRLVAYVATEQDPNFQEISGEANATLALVDNRSYGYFLEVFFYWEVPSQPQPTLQLRGCSVKLAGGFPDLVIEDLTYSPAAPTTEDEILVTATVANFGAGPAGPSHLSLRIGGETYPESFEVPMLPVGGRYSVERRVTLGGPRSYQATAAADADDELFEVDEENVASVVWRVTSPP